ncbi:MAG TPA: 6-bladed beta-propeller [Longimicrobiales bacterium]|nr:6-bladed beta-propeller [Longimicrobiales bacterium]
MTFRIPGVRSMRGTRRAFVLLMLATAACADSPESAVVTEPIAIGEPVLLIGADESRDGHLLHRVTTVVRHEDGRILLANSGSGEVRVFSPDGELVRSFSRSGSGPGEHQFLARLWLAGDTIITYDPLAERLNYWSIEGELLSDARFADGPHHLRHRVETGRFVSAPVSQQPFAKGTSRIDSSAVSLVSPGLRAISVVTAPAQTRFGATLPDGGTIFTPLPLEPQLSVAANERQIIVGYGGDTVVSRYGADGSLLGQVPLPMRSEALSEQAKSAWQETMFERVSADERAQMERYLASLPYSADLPVFDRILVDDEDRIWVRQFHVPGRDSTTWSVVDPDGERFAVVRAPAAADIRHISHGHAVGILSRADGAEQVAVWRIPEH